MRDATFAFLARLQKELAKLDYGGDPYKLAELLKIRLLTGEVARASAGPPRVIILPPEIHGNYLRFTIFHEIMHVLMQAFDFEDDIAGEVDDEDSEWHIELVANFAAALAIMPEEMVAYAEMKFGFSPAAILFLSAVGKVSVPAAMRRLTSANPEAERGAFITSGIFISDVVTCNRPLPFYRYDRVPEVHIALPDAMLFDLHDAKILGTMAW